MRVPVMSPELFAPFDGIQDVFAMARDENLRLLWANEEFLRFLGQTLEQALGTDLTPHFPAAFVQDRIERLGPAIRGESTVAYYQLLRGQRRFTRAWPLDPDSFGCRGVFILITPALEAPAMEEGDLFPVAGQADYHDLEVLSDRELEVLYHLATGLSAKEIAAKLFRAPSTIERHIESIHAKLGFSNRAELVRFVVERGLLGFTPEEWTLMIESTRK
ncbi:MAG: hypothetical protein KF866_05770 [Phycisphaeraceae bacterium]|nr:hypothetical protein [Phycisphaeraceae bacterium]MCW5754502.1 hypothetical protein [Phycisphaeraceae bacterium]